MDHIGQHNAIPVAQLAKKIGFEDTASCPALRQIISDLIDGGMPIGACSRGYFLIRSKDELKEYVANLASRRNEIDRRIRSVRAAFEG